MSQGNYSFQSEPQAVHAQTRKKYRDPFAPPEPLPKSNIMHDRRVVRGNTYAAQVPSLAQTRIQEAQMARLRRQQAMRTQKRMGGSRQRERLATDPVEGRQHMVVQTESYLEEIDDKPFEQDFAAQTDPVDERPTVPIFKPKTIGVDQATWIEDGELFDFELAVEPILEVLVGKSLDQGLTEVLEEEELKLLERRRIHFEEKRNQATAEAQRMEQANIRREQEKERRLKQERDRIAHEQTVAKKVASKGLAGSYLAGMQNGVMANLEEAGHFYDPVLKEVEDEFVPWLLDSVSSRVRDVAGARGEVDEILSGALSKIFSAVAEEKQRLKEEAERKAAEEEAERQRLLKEEEERKEKERLEAEAKAKAEAEAAAADEGDEEEEDV